MPEGLAVLVVAQVHAVVDGTEIHGVRYHSLVVGAPILLGIDGFHEEDPILHATLREVE